eukprot:404927_1
MVMLIALVFFVSIFKTSLGNFECYDYESVISGPDEGDIITIGCTAPNEATYHIVACGFKTEYSYATDVDGVYYDADTYSIPRCVVRNAVSSSYSKVRATARCCTLPQDAILTPARDTINFVSDQDNEIAAISCGQVVPSPTLANTYLFGCSASSTDNIIDGGFYTTTTPAENEANNNANVDMDFTIICSAVASSSGGKVYPDGICVTSPTIDITCKRRSSAAAIGSGAIASTTCSNGYILMGCVGWGDHSNVNAWYTEGNSCKARGGLDGAAVYSSAICCMLGTTNAPTQYPTVSTQIPSINPTQTPSINPTQTPSQIPSYSPSNPSVSPTNVPTISPTNVPTNTPTYFTNNPTNNPSVSPTNIPTYTTNIPTYNPTIVPTFTYNPTNIPTNNPTNIPTNNPTNIPTNTPTKKPTNIPTNTPTNEGRLYEPSIAPTMFVGSSTQHGELNVSESDALTNNFIFQRMTLFIGGFLVVIIVISYVYSKFIYQNDFYQVIALITASFHILDMVSDVLFSISMSVSNNIIFILSVMFIVIPLMLSLYQLHRVIYKKWMRSDDEIKGWIRDNISILFILSVITGSSFAAIDLCYSNLFNLRQFDIPLSKTEISLFKTKRIYSIILFENLPQIALQCGYIASSTTVSNSSIIYISLIFSSISIAIAVISLLTQKAIINRMDYVELTFDVIGKDVSANTVKCQSIVKKPQREITGILGINKNLTEIFRPTQIPNGLCVKMNLYISISKAIDKNCQKLMENAKNNGKLSETFQNAWGLSSKPMINNIKCSQVNSKERDENTINIATDTVEMQMIQSIENNEGNSNVSLINTDVNAIPEVPHVIQDYGKTNSGIPEDSLSDHPVNETVGGGINGESN